MKIKKKPVVKNTFWMIYEEEFKTIFFIFGFFFGVLLLAIILVGLAYCWESVKCVFKYVAIIGSIIGIIYPMIKYIKYFLNQRRIPLTMEELGELNIKTVEEYSEYLYKFLNGILPNRKLIIRIFLVAYFKFNEDKGYKEIHQSLCS